MWFQFENEDSYISVSPTTDNKYVSISIGNEGKYIELIVTRTDFIKLTAMMSVIEQNIKDL